MLITRGNTSHEGLRWCIGIVLFIVGGLSLYAKPQSQSLNSVVEQLTQLQEEGTRISLVLQSFDEAESSVIAFGQDQWIPAASISKLFTTYAALNILGPEYQFKTAAYVDSKQLHSGVLNAPLVIKGYGDPFLVSERLWMFAQKLKGYGLKVFKQGIEIDQSYFVDYPKIILKQQPDSGNRDPYLSPLAPTSLNFNAITFGFFPDLENSKKIQTHIFPESMFYLVEDQLKPALRSQWEARPKAVKDRVVFELKGRVITQKETYGYQAVTHPASYVGHVLAHMLRGMGIQVEGKIQERTSQGLIEQKGITAILFESLPLSDLIKSANKYSNNFMTDMLVFALGVDEKTQTASYERGRQRILNWLATQGLEQRPEHFQIASGLSHQNQVRASLLIKLLQHAWKNARVGPEFFASLPRSASAGTLRGLSPEISEVRAKTGSLAHVSNLVGILHGQSGKPYFVVFLSTHPKKDAVELQRIRDQLLYTVSQKL